MVITDAKTNPQQPLLPTHASSSTPAPYGPPVPPPFVVVPIRRESAARRFLKAFAVAILIWLLFSALVGSIVDASLPHLFSSGAATEPRASDGHVQKCLSPEYSLASNDTVFSFTPKHTKSYRVELPTLSSKLYLFTRGNTATGTVSVERYESSGFLVPVQVEIEVAYDSDEAFGLSKVCLLDRGDSSTSEHGIGIYAPIYSHHFDLFHQLHYNIKYRIPISSTGPVALGAFETRLSNFVHEFGDLHNWVKFTTLSLHSSNGHVAAKSVDADIVHIKTSNARISGDFSAANITAHTSNGAISGNFTISPGLSLAAPYNLALTTSNARINANTRLEEPLMRLLPLAYRVTARTSNGALWLAMPTAAENARLDLSARTSNADAELILHPLFEGRLSAQTSNKKLSVDIEKAVRNGLKRRVSGTVDRKSWRGTADWGEGAEDRFAYGSADVRTSNGNCALKLPCLDFCQ